MKWIQLCLNESKNALPKFKNLILQKQRAHFNQTWHKAFLDDWDLKGLSFSTGILWQNGINTMTKFKNHLQNHRVNSNKTWRNVSLFEGNLSYHLLWNNHGFAQKCLLIGNVPQVSDKAHGPLVHDWPVDMQICTKAHWAHFGRKKLYFSSNSYAFISKIWVYIVTRNFLLVILNHDVVTKYISERRGRYCLWSYFF